MRMLLCLRDKREPSTNFRNFDEGADGSMMRSSRPLRDANPDLLRPSKMSVRRLFNTLMYACRDADRLVGRGIVSVGGNGKAVGSNSCFFAANFA